MAEREDFYNPNTKRMDSRETKGAKEIERSTAEYDPRTAGRTADRPGRPKQSDYISGPDDYVGQAKFTKAERAWRRSVQEEALQK